MRLEMRETLMTSQQVCEARRRAWASDDLSAAQLAREMELPYSVVYCALIGKTWSLITDPKPLPTGLLRKRRRSPIRVCTNCGRCYDTTGGTTIRCGACSHYWYRHGKERPKVIDRSQWQLTDRELAALYGRYMKGEGLETIAARLPFSAETLRRRFVAAGLALRERIERRQRLSAALVRRAREIVHIDRVPVAELARSWGVNYTTLYSAVMGQSWSEAGGPLPGGDLDEEKRPCERCGMLTVHSSGLCQFCR